MSDLISRQAAIDAMESTDWYHIGPTGELVHGANSKIDEPLYRAEDVYRVLESLPAIIRCQECVWWEDTPCNTIAPEYHKCRRVFGKISMTAMDYCSGAERRPS